MSAVSEERQKWIARNYLERNIAPDGRLNYMRNVIFNDKLINSYYDPDFINYIFTQHIKSALPENEKCMIADFGCGSGLVAKTVVEQLGRPDVLPIGFDTYNKDYWRGYKPIPEIQTFQRDLKDLRFTSNTFHAGILRFALPFIRENDQPEVLKQIYEVLKPGAVLVVLNDGAFNETERDKSWNTLLAECVTFEGLTSMHYPSFDSLKVIVEKVRFQIKDKKDLTDIAFGYLSPQICARAFKPNKDQRKRLKTLFEKWKQKDVLPFEPEFLRPKPRSLRVLWPMYTCVLEK